MKSKGLKWFVSTLVAVGLLVLVSGSALAYTITYTQYKLGSNSNTYFTHYSSQVGLKAYGYTYTHEEDGYDRSDFTDEILDEHYNMGSHYRDEYSWTWGPLGATGKYWSNGVQVASLYSYSPVSMIVPSGWGTWGGVNYNNVSVTKTIGGRRVLDSVTVTSDSWDVPKTLDFSYYF